MFQAWVEPRLGGLTELAQVANIRFGALDAGATEQPIPRRRRFDDVLGADRYPQRDAPQRSGIEASAGPALEIRRTKWERQGL